MAKFKCLLSGTVVEFKEPYDIESMKGHPQYELVVEEVKEKEVEKEDKPKKAK